MERMTDEARAVMAGEEGEAADRDLWRFLTLAPLSAGGAQAVKEVGQESRTPRVVAHAGQILQQGQEPVPDSLGTSSKETGVAGFFPLLQVWAYYHLPSLGRGVARRRGAVRWTPYVGEDDATQPWVDRGHPYFGRDIWLHCFNTVVLLHHRLVSLTLGFHQAAVEFPTRQRAWEQPGWSFRGMQQVTDWTVQVREQLDDWEQRGMEVVSEATSDEDYFWAYARKYGAQLDPEGRISSLEGILHSTIQQRDDLQAVVDQLRVELDQAQQVVGGASSSQEDPGRSVLEGQLAVAVARAEDALGQLQERERELRDALARTATLEAEMAVLRLRPEAAEVAQWRQEAAEAARWCQEAAEAARWRQEAEEAARLRAEAADLRT
ncbi:hypothetical protein Taro_002787 [Colocasia esculenta]|uniref:Uncharacterized protein n=1 Tax=Colocasia esculenta TaxID=4460 RepID=A0A843TLV9_COLES|nr:hypothetical protein [Colocasia esculenta]